MSCDSCLKNNFRGKRYKCVICYDYDLCATCYEAGATSSRHTADHPMQCILTRADFGEYMPTEYVCIFCSCSEQCVKPLVSGQQLVPSLMTISAGKLSRMKTNGSLLSVYVVFTECTCCV